jgi:pimeloyl-ACP methyl ester carboxylesterase
MFAPQVQDLSDEFRCITWDQRGFGQTVATRPFNYYDSAADCLALLRHLGLDQAVLAGMSQGGYLSLRAAFVDPARVKALVLIDTQAGVENPETRGGYDAMRDEWLANGPGNVQDAIASLILGGSLDRSPWFAKWALLPRESFALAYECLVERDDIRARLGEITSPAVVFHGTLDQAIEMPDAEALCAGLPHCIELVKVEGAAHAGNLSHPDQVNPRLREFLRKYA